MKLSNLSNAKFVEKAIELFKQDRSASHKWRKEAREDFEFVAGDQWSQEDEAFLRDAGRPVITFNRIAPVIDGIVGTELSNRQEARYLPRTNEDGTIAENYTEVARWVMDGCDAEDEETQAFNDAAICGMGWTETWVDFETDPDGKITVDRFSPLEAYWDRTSTKQNLADAKRVYRLRRIPKHEVKEKFPGRKIRFSGDQSLDKPEPLEPHDAEDTDYVNDQSGRRERSDDVPILQMQWAEREPFFRAVNPETGEIEEVEAENVEPLLNEFPELQMVRQTRRTYWQAFIVGKTLLSKERLHPSEGEIPGFTLRPITVKWDEKRKMWYGLVRAMKDPQRWANKFFSQVQDILNSQAKGGILAEKDAFENVQKAEEDWAKSDTIVWANPGAVQAGKIKERPAGKFPVGIDRLHAQAVSATRDVTGVSLEFLGLTGRIQPGITEQQRIGQGLAVLARFFNALRRYRKEHGRVLLHLINLYIPDQTQFRITSIKTGTFNKQESAKFDIIVDQAPTSANAQAETWNALQQILPPMLSAGMPIPPDVMEMLPIQQSLKEKFLRFFESQQPSPQDIQIQEAAKQLELQGMQADVALKQAQALAAVMKAQAAQGGVQNNATQTIVEAVLKAAEIDVEEKKAEAQMISAKKSNSASA